MSLKIQRRDSIGSKVYLVNGVGRIGILFQGILQIPRRKMFIY